MRSNPFKRHATVPTGFTVSPYTLVRGTVLEMVVDPQERGRADSGTGFFHVTTNLPAVLAEGRLRSRKELRAAGVQGAGLGGGIRDEAAHLISVGLTLDGAMRVMGATRLMADAVHGRIDSKTAMKALDKSLAPALDLIDSAADWMGEDPDRDEFNVANGYDETKGTLEWDVLQATPGPELYTALTQYEEHIANTLLVWESEGYLDTDEHPCVQPVGFTEPAHKFERVLPENIGLVQLAARRTARPDPVPGECELRFRPEDLVIVAVWQSAPTKRGKRNSPGTLRNPRGLDVRQGIPGTYRTRFVAKGGRKRTYPVQGGAPWDRAMVRVASETTLSGGRIYDTVAAAAREGRASAPGKRGSVTVERVTNPRPRAPRKNPRDFYHVTEQENAPDILAEGFYPGWGDVGYGVYFYGTLESAKAYARRGGWDRSLKHPVILAVSDPRIRKIEEHELDPGWDRLLYTDMYVLDADEADDGPVVPRSVQIVNPRPRRRR